MSLFNRLLKQLEERGLRVEPGAEPGQLLLCGPRDAKTPEIVRAVKAFKPQLLDRFAPREPPTTADPEPELQRPEEKPPPDWARPGGVEAADIPD